MILFQIPHSMGLYICATKFKFRKPYCGPWHFHSCLWHISAIVDSILTLSPLSLYVLFSLIILICHNIFYVMVPRGVLKCPCKTDVFIHIWSMYFHIFSCMTSPGSWKVVVNIEINRFSVAFKPLATSLPCPGAPTQQSIIILYTCDKIDSKYKAVSHMYLSAQT